MKNIFYLLLILICLRAVETQAQTIPQNPNKTDAQGLRQGNWTILYDKDWKVAKDTSQAKFYRVINYKDDLPVGKVRDYYRSGKIQWQGRLLKDRPEELMNGRCIWYYENGNIEQVNWFRVGKLVKTEEYHLNGVKKEWKKLNREGLKAYKTGKYQQAIIILKKAKNQAAREFGKKHPDYATSCNNLALLYASQGKYAKAEPLFLEAKRIEAQVLGTNHPDYVVSCNNLAELYKFQGKYAKAEPLYLEAKRIAAKVLGTNHPNYATSCGNLASLYIFQGKYAKAEPLFLEAKRIYAKVLGTNHPDYATSCGNLAGLYESQGKYAKAEPLYLEAKRIYTKVLGTNHPDYAASCSNLAGLYQSQGKYAKAEPLYLEAKRIYTKVLGTNHPSYVTSCNNLAMLYQAKGNYAKAKSLFEESLNIRAKSLGRVNFTYAYTCSNLASMYNAQKRYKQAIGKYKLAKGIYENKRAQYHSNYARICLNLAKAYAQQGLFKQALSTLEEVIPQIQKQVKNSLFVLNEEERQYFLNQIDQNYLQAYNSFVIKLIKILGKSNSIAFVSKLYDYHIYFKSLYFTPVVKVKRSLQGGDSVLVKQFKQLTNEARLVGGLQKSSTSQLDRRKVNFHLLLENLSSLEAKIARKSADFAQLIDKYKPHSWKEVQKNLKPGEIAIEFIRFDWFDKKAKDSVYYVALIVTPKSSHPEPVMINNGRYLEKEGLLVYKSNFDQRTEDKVSYQNYWLPIKKALQKIYPRFKKAYLSLTGVYHQINFLALYNPKSKKYLMDEVDIQIVPNTSELIKKKHKVGAGQQSLIYLFGYPDFQKYPNPLREVRDTMKLKKASPNSREKLNGQQQNIVNLTTSATIAPRVKLKPIPGTKIEIREVQKNLNGKFPVATYEGMAASEDNIKSLRNPKLLHIATHGFYLNDSELLARVKNKQYMIGNFNLRKCLKNPLQRSALLLTGAQACFDGVTCPKDFEDGVLTAQEVLHLFLKKTDLVVLSACETGKTKIQKNVGVQSLSGAFMGAGAKSVIMSLRKVDDKASRWFMQYFYDFWLVKRNSIRIAFRLAQRKLRQDYPSPYYWGAFVLVQR